VIVQQYVEFETEDWDSGFRVHDTKSKSVNSTGREDGKSTTGIKSVEMGTEPPSPASGGSSTYEPAATLEQVPVNSLTGSPQLLVQGPGLAFLQSVKTAATEKDRLAVLESQGGGTGFSFDFGNPPPSAIKKNRAGFVISAIGEHFPATLGQGMSTEVSYLAPCGLIPPHLHPRASQTLVVTRGTIKTQFLAGDGMHLQSLTLKELQAGHLPQGAIHYEMNPTCEPAGYVSSFSSDDPGMTFVAPSLLSIDNPAVLGAFGNPDINAAYLDSMRSTIPSGIVETVRLCQRACESLMHAGGGKLQKLRRDSSAEQGSEQDGDREQVGGDLSVKQMLQQITPNLELLLQDLTLGELLDDIDSDNVRDQSSEKFAEGTAWKPRHSLLSVRDVSHQEESSTAGRVAYTADETNETDENPYLAYDVNEVPLDDHGQDYSANEEDHGEGGLDEYALDDHTTSIPGVADLVAEDSSVKDLPDYSGDVDFELPQGSDIVPIEDVDYDFQEHRDDLNLLDDATPLYSASRWPNWKLIKDHVFGPVRVEDKEPNIVSYNVPHKNSNYKAGLTGPVSSVIPSKPQIIPPADSIHMQSTTSEPIYINSTAILVHSKPTADYPQIPSKVQCPGIFPRPPIVETTNPAVIPADDEDDDNDYDEGEEEEEEEEEEEDVNGFLSILRTPRHEHRTEDETVDIYSQSDDTEGKLILGCSR
jgi:quercetin dioxygenase-like cupin family protein